VATGTQFKCYPTKIFWFTPQKLKLSWYHKTWNRLQFLVGLNLMHKLF